MALTDARHLPAGRHHARDRHLKSHVQRDNLGLDPVSVLARERDQVEMPPEKEKSSSSSRSTLLTNVTPSGTTHRELHPEAYPDLPAAVDSRPQAEVSRESTRDPMVERS